MSTCENYHVFGTYRLKGRLLELALDQGLSEMIKAGYAAPLVDTATMYHNDAQILKVLSKYPNVLVCSKIKQAGEAGKVELKHLIETYGDRLKRVILHKYMSTDNFDNLLVAKRAGLVKEIGVSNYSVAQLEELIGKCNGKPDVVQNEFHPFLRTSVPAFCKKHGIKFEAHSVMTRIDSLQPFATEWGVSAGQIALAYAFQAGGGGACFSSCNFHHVVEDLDVQTLSPSQLLSLAELVDRLQLARYKGADGLTWTAGSLASDLAALDEAQVDALCQQMVPQLLADVRALHEGGRPSSLAFTIPERPVGNALMVRLAALVVNNFAPPAGASARVADLARVHRLSHLLKRIRKRAFAADAAAKAAAKGAGGAGQTCRGPGAATVEDPAALPVDIPPANVFAHVIDALRALPTPPGVALRFEKGTLFPDGRMDMCKQVAQPAFEDLCAAVGASGAVRHFLLGNNLALAGDDEAADRRLAALTTLLASDPPIETWYLAGNGIDGRRGAAVAAALESATCARHVWLKMNPLKAAGAAAFGRLAARSPQLELLDLFNTGLGDAGAAALLAGIAGAGGTAGLRHLYLDINGISDPAPLVALLAALPQLESLFLSVNRLGDAGALALCAALRAGAAPRLRRLGLGSVGATDALLPGLAAAAAGGATALVAVELGSYKSTRFFGEAGNRLADPAGLVPVGRALRANADRAAAAAAAAGERGGDGEGLCYLGFQHAVVLPPSPPAGEPDAAAAALEAAAAALEAAGVCFNGIQYHGRGRMTPATPALRRCRHPAAVDHIESVYRNKMS